MFIFSNLQRRKNDRLKVDTFVEVTYGTFDYGDRSKSRSPGPSPRIVFRDVKLEPDNANIVDDGDTIINAIASR